MTESELLDLALGAAMFGLMFAMGLSLGPDDFRRIATRPRATLVGTGLQLVVMPVVGIALAHALSLPAILAAGIVVVSACPGGMFSNMYVHLARGHTALSITLTATATLVTLFTLPLWARFALASFSTPGTTAVEMPVLETALRLATLTVLPVAIGMAARQRFPGLTRLERRLSIGAAIAIVLVMVRKGGEQPEIPLEAFLDATVAAGSFALAAIAVGVLLPALLRIDARDTATIAVELVVKNTLLGLVLVGQTLDFEASLPIFAFALFQTPAGIALLVGWRMLERRGWLGRRHPACEEAVAAEVLP